MEIFRDSPVSLNLDIPNVVETEVTATIIRDGVEVYEASGSNVPLPFKIYGYDGPFEVRWEFFVPGDPLLHTRYEAHEIVTPLVDLAGATQEEIEGERLVRRIIEGLTGQSFGFSFGARAVQGSGGHVLKLPQRIINLVGVSLNVYPYDSIPFGPIHISDGGWSITAASGPVHMSVKAAPPEEAIYYSGGVIVAPGHVTSWNPGNVYIITGSWGYEGIPAPVEEAAKILIDDYNCPEDTYRNKFIDNMRSADWRIEFNPRTWAGTGNIKADQLLAPYMRTNMGVI